jgi:hypothetical protein
VEDGRQKSGVGPSTGSGTEKLEDGSLKLEDRRPKLEDGSPKIEDSSSFDEGE